MFELLLRLKGNYLWPAMWSARFGDDGPGLANAKLADEYGIIMGMSHHEPCLRQGEEYKYLRGKDSVYGDAWNFRTNREGIIRFWKDGLLRRGKFENVITLGMRCLLYTSSGNRYTDVSPLCGNDTHDAADYLHLSVFTEIFCHRSYTRWRKRIIPYKSEGAYAIPSCRCPLKTV